MPLRLLRTPSGSTTDHIRHTESILQLLCLSPVIRSEISENPTSPTFPFWEYPPAEFEYAALCSWEPGPITGIRERQRRTSESSRSFVTMISGSVPRLPLASSTY